LDAGSSAPTGAQEGLMLTPEHCGSDLRTTGIFRPQRGQFIHGRALTMRWMSISIARAGLNFCIGSFLAGLGAGLPALPD